MTVLAASDNGGRYNTAHRQTDDGIVFSVAADNNLVPISFTYFDYLDEPHTILISSGHYPHAKLMHNDGGVEVSNDSEILLFSWEEFRKKIDGFTINPKTGEYEETYHEEPNCAKDAAIKGIKSHRTVVSRKDKEYWTTDNTVKADYQEDLFGFEQYNPQSCPPRESGNCGFVTYKEKC